ncbi:MAG: redoxin family protein [Xanthomonadaceae bacterium]|nr:redoxin family protein [Xanthomonadaceae bacterium]MDE2085385.1 redoxin family protein [Xanthomonadaceae bacterium]MDE2258417.1 redoxin family protein [Xanthomonadaceae bacterium]
MRLTAPSPAPTVALLDIEGRPIDIGKGRRMLLSLFREATCPFCNFRVYELTHNHRAFSSLGLDVVAVFHSSREDVLKFIARQPRPFRMVADPQARLHEAFGVEKSFWGKLRAMMLRMSAMIRGLRMTGMRGMRTDNLMPADFLIDENGKVVETYYGRDAGDHIPIERVELFMARGIASRRMAA